MQPTRREQVFSARRFPARTYGPPASELQQQRISRGWTQRELGALVAGLLRRPKAYSGVYMHMIETGAQPAPVAIVGAMAVLFGVEADVARSWIPSIPRQAAA